MKRLVTVIAAVLMIFCFSLRAESAELHLFDGDKQSLENSVPDEAEQGLDEIGVNGVDGIITGGVDLPELAEYLGALLSRYSAGPMSALILIVSVVIIASIAESYTYSLRYTHTKDIMSAASGLLIISAVIKPFSGLAADSAAVISACSSMLLVYLPLMAGILAFSGRAISSAGYYSAVAAGAGLLSKLSSSVLLPLLNVILSLSVCAGITNRINLGSVIEMTSKCFKWFLTFSVSTFAAVVGMNSALASAGDSLSGKAAKFTLSSFVPLIGGSLAEAYQTLKGSLGLLRSGMGVFVILAMIVSFAPLLVRTVLWSLAIATGKLVAETFCVTSASRVFNALSAYLSALRAVIIGVLCAFVLSSAVMMRVGGS